MVELGEPLVRYQDITWGAHTDQPSSLKSWFFFLQEQLSSTLSHVSHRSHPHIASMHTTLSTIIYIFPFKKKYLHGIHPSIYAPIYQSIHLSMHPSINPSIYLCIHLSIHLSIHTWRGGGGLTGGRSSVWCGGRRWRGHRSVEGRRSVGSRGGGAPVGGELSKETIGGKYA